MRLILASNSPRRRELLTSLGLQFSVQTDAALDESRVLAQLHGDLEQRLTRLAQLKGAEIARGCPADTVLSADTVVLAEQEVLGKPRDNAEAQAMLSRLSGRTHTVLTAVCVQREMDGLVQSGVESTRVSFNLLDAETIARYVERAQPFDFAGSYAIQGLGALLVRKIDGDYSNVVGLPLGLTTRLLAEAGMRVL
jgi:septum formation protein